MQVVWNGVHTLLVAFSGNEARVDVERSGGSILVTIDGVTHELPRDTATQLTDKVEMSLTERREFFRTAGVHREDGSYVVERRNAESEGNETVFGTFEEVRRLFDRLPSTFDAETIARSGITGSRRHMLVRHFVEHPAFDCELASRNPLQARKTDTTDGSNPDTASAD